MIREGQVQMGGQRVTWSGKYTLSSGRSGSLHTGDEWADALPVLSERERSRRDPDQRDEESDPGENQEAGL